MSASFLGLVNSLPCYFKIAIPAESLRLAPIYCQKWHGREQCRPNQCLINCLHIAGVLAAVLHVPAYGDA